MSVFRTKSIEQSIRDTDDPDTKLRKDLGALDLTVFGVGVIIGAGIFVLTGTVAATNSGPALALSFLIAALACGLAGLCYAEFASTVPVAGSAYTFSYATLGELVAWTIGWDLVLEFTIGSAALAAGFSGYFQTVLDIIGITLPTSDLLGQRRVRQPAGHGDRPAGDGAADPRHQGVQPLQPDRRRRSSSSSSRSSSSSASRSSTSATGRRSSPSRSRPPTPAAVSASCR